MPHQHPNPHEVPVHIDREKYQSPKTTTHSALYTLGKVQDGWQLFAEALDKHKEDKPLRKDEASIHVREDEHFYSRQVEYKIFVNSREKTVHVAVLSYEDVLKLAFDPVPEGPTVAFSVSYTRGEGSHREGQLDVGEVVTINNGMNFNVSKTNKS
jgi:hypothetical protein